MKEKKNVEYSKMKNINEEKKCTWRKKKQQQRNFWSGLSEEESLYVPWHSLFAFDNQIQLKKKFAQMRKLHYIVSISQQIDFTVIAFNSKCILWFVLKAKRISLQSVATRAISKALKW